MIKLPVHVHHSKVSEGPKMSVHTGGVGKLGQIFEVHV